MSMERWQSAAKVCREEPVLVPLYPSKILNELALDQTWAFAVRTWTFFF
jgi:hypothetical protein